MCTGQMKTNRFGFSCGRTLLAFFLCDTWGQSDSVAQSSLAFFPFFMRRSNNAPLSCTANFLSAKQSCVAVVAAQDTLWGRERAFNR